MKKTYVIDTNILIQAPHAFLCFEENDVVRMLDQYRNRGDLLQGVTLPDGGTLRIEKNYKAVELSEDMPEDKADNRILKICKGLSQDLGKKHGIPCNEVYQTDAEGNRIQPGFIEHEASRRRLHR